MPLLDGKLDIPNLEGPPVTVDDGMDDRKYFRVAKTGEVFSSYEEYTLRLRQITSRNWSSLSSGKDGLSYEQAMLEDKDAEALIAKVSAPLLRNPLLQVVSCGIFTRTVHKACCKITSNVIMIPNRHAQNFVSEMVGCFAQKVHSGRWREVQSDRMPCISLCKKL
jgi:hypothetical protein